MLYFVRGIKKRSCLRGKKKGGSADLDAPMNSQDRGVRLVSDYVDLVHEEEH
jgi:hypothetical protein